MCGVARLTCTRNLPSCLFFGTRIWQIQLYKDAVSHLVSCGELCPWEHRKLFGTACPQEWPQRQCQGHPPPTAWKRKRKRHPPLLDEHVPPKHYRLFQQTRPRASEQLCHVHRTFTHISVSVFEWYPPVARRIFVAQGRVCDGYA